MRGPQIILHRPQIPQNTGNISRLCVAIRSKLIITGKAGFNWDSASLKRAGLDHWEHLDFQNVKRLSEILVNPSRRIIAVSKVGDHNIFDFKFNLADVLLFGNETQGLPPSALKRCTSIRLPMIGPVRSLNLSNTVAICAYEYLRQIYGAQFDHSHKQYARTYYTRSK